MNPPETQAGVLQSSNTKYVRAHVPRSLGQRGLAFELRTVGPDPEVLALEGQRVTWAFEHGFEPWEAFADAPVTHPHKAHLDTDPKTLKRVAEILEAGFRNSVREHEADMVLRWILRDWRRHPVLTRLPPEDRKAALARIHDATEHLVEDILVSEGDPDQLYAAATRWAHRSALLPLFVEVLPPELQQDYLSSLYAPLLGP
jgi:hypothetical protein